jgi:two-component system LytT family sensor kinase
MLRILRIVLINSIVGVLLFSYLYYSETKGVLVYFENLWIVSGVILGSNLLGWSIISLGKLLDKLYIWKKSIILRFLLEITIDFILVIGLLWIFFGLFGDVLFKIGLSNLIVKYSETTIRVFILTFVSLFFYTIIDFALYSYNQYSVAQIESIKVSREQLVLQFDALKSQLSPHYLFNNLNTFWLQIA